MLDGLGSGSLRCLSIRSANSPEQQRQDLTHNLSEAGVVTVYTIAVGVAIDAVAVCLVVC